MNRPERDAETVLARARAGLSPSEADEARVRRTLAAAIAVSAGGGAAVAAVPSFFAKGHTALAVWTTRVIVVAVVAAGAGTVGYRFGYGAGRRAGSDAATTAALAKASPTAPRVTQPEGPLPAPAATGNTTPVAPRAAPARAATPARLRSSAAGSPTAASLEAEVRALRGVERALRDHEPGMALELLRELDRAVPNGQLLEEREATSAVARCTLGNVPFGVDLARDFAERHPDSVYLQRVEQTCAAPKGRP